MELVEQRLDALLYVVTNLADSVKVSEVETGALNAYALELLLERKLK